jgi:hypothetical protein
MTVAGCVTLLAASKLLGRHRQTVLTLAASGDLVADRRAGLTFISRDSLDAYRARLAKQQKQSKRAAGAA